jgi:ABC-type branched-subunit amino acid transport system substrate-binding protein
LFAAVCLLLAGCVTNTVTNGWDFRKFNPNAGTPPSSPSPAPDAPAKTQEPPAVAATPAPDSIPAPTPPLQNDTAPPVEPAKAVINVAGDVPAGEMRVAILLPLSGANATLGRAMLNAAQLSLFELADKNFVLMTYDTRGDANGAAQAAESATRDGAGLILGPLLAESVAAARARVQDIGAGLNIVAFSNSREVAGDGVFILGFTPRQQVTAILDYAASEGVSRVVALAPDNGYGRAVVDAAWSHSGGLFETVYYDPLASDFTEQVKTLARYSQRRGALREHRQALSEAGDDASLRTLRRLEQRDTLGDPPFDAVLLPESGKNLRTLSSLLSYYDVDAPSVRLLGLRSWDLTPNLAAEPALKGAWFSATPEEGRIGFGARYKAAFGARPPRHASLAYDATALAIVLARTADGANGDAGAVFNRAALMSRSGFLGVDGVFRFQADGVAERPFTIFEVTGGGVVVRRPAPQTFQRLTN